MVKHELPVTSCESLVTSYELKVKSASSNPGVTKSSLRIRE